MCYAVGNGVDGRVKTLVMLAKGKEGVEAFTARRIVESGDGR